MQNTSGWRRILAGPEGRVAGVVSLLLLASVLLGAFYLPRVLAFVDVVFVVAAGAAMCFAARGRAAAQVIMEDMGIDFKKVTGK